MKLTLINKSDWPTPMLKVLAKWVLRQESIDWDYTITVRGCRSNTWGGRGARRFQRIWLDVRYGSGSGWKPVAPKSTVPPKQRRYWRQSLAEELRRLRVAHYPNSNLEKLHAMERDEIPEECHKARMLFKAVYETYSKPGTPTKVKWPLTVKDHRFKWSKPEEYHNRMEVLVMLLAHEAHHATQGHPDRFKVGHAINRDAMEYQCNAAGAGAAAVAAMRVEFPAIRDAIRKAMAAERGKVKVAKATAAVRRTDPSPKRDKMQAMLAKWQRKAKLAAGKVRLYSRKVRYYEGRMAAKS